MTKRRRQDDSPAYVLIDGVERNRLYPETFEIPAQLERDNLQVGQSVKLGFEWAQQPKNAAAGERMWVKIAEVIRAADGAVYRGTLSNHPMVFAGRLAYGDTVEFHPRHVLTTETGPHPKVSAPEADDEDSTDPEVIAEDLRRQVVAIRGSMAAALERLKEIEAGLGDPSKAFDVVMDAEDFCRQLLWVGGDAASMQATAMERHMTLEDAR